MIRMHGLNFRDMLWSRITAGILRLRSTRECITNCNILTMMLTPSACADGVKLCALRRTFLSGESPQSALVVGRIQPMTRVSIVRWNLKEVGWQISDLTYRNHIRLQLRIRLQLKLKSNNYSELTVVNVADRWRERDVWYQGRSCQQEETEYETCSNNEWQEVSRGHSTTMVANIVGRTEL